MTNAQLQVLKAEIIADPVLSSKPLNSDGYNDIAVILNGTVATPAFLVYRPSVPQIEIMLNGFDWTRVDNLSVGKARIWEWMFDNPDKAINPSKANIRAGIESCWTGTTADLAVRAVVYGHCAESATRTKKLFAVVSAAPPATSGALGSSTNIATAVVEVVTADDVQAARALP